MKAIDWSAHCIRRAALITINDALMAAFCLRPHSELRVQMAPFGVRKAGTMSFHQVKPIPTNCVDVRFEWEQPESVTCLQPKGDVDTSGDEGPE